MEVAEVVEEVGLEEMEVKVAMYNYDRVAFHAEEVVEEVEDMVEKEEMDQFLPQLHGLVEAEGEDLEMMDVMQEMVMEEEGEGIEVDMVEVVMLMNLVKMDAA